MGGHRGSEKQWNQAGGRAGWGAFFVLEKILILLFFSLISWSGALSLEAHSD